MAFADFSWRDLPAPYREVNHRADVWKMMPIAHFDIRAGEYYDYRLRTETAGLLPAEAPVGEVQIPGARLENIQFLPEEGTATINWHLPAGVPRRYELLRSVDDAAAQVIFQSEDPTVASFTDVLIEGNRKYTYRLRNTMDRDVVLESRDMFIYPYQRRRDFNIVEAPNCVCGFDARWGFLQVPLWRYSLHPMPFQCARSIMRDMRVARACCPCPTARGCDWSLFLLSRSLLDLLLLPMCCSAVFWQRPGRCSFLRLGCSFLRFF